MRKRATKRRKSKQNKKKRRNTNKKIIFGGELNDTTAIHLVRGNNENPDEHNRRIDRLEAMMPFYKRGIESLKRKNNQLLLKKNRGEVIQGNDIIIYERVAVRLYDRLSLFDNYFIELAKGNIDMIDVNQIISNYFRVDIDFPPNYEQSVRMEYVGEIPGAVTRPNHYVNNLVSPSATPLYDSPLGGNEDE